MSSSPTNHNLLITRMKGWNVYVRPGSDTDKIANHSVLLTLERGSVAAYFYETPEKCIGYLPITGLDIDDLLTQFNFDKDDKIQRVYQAESGQRTGLKSLLKKTVNKIADIDAVLQTLIDFGAPTQIMGLGYISNEAGVCAGLTAMWTHAKLLGQEDKFFERIRFICSHDNLKNAIQQAEAHSVEINQKINVKYAEEVHAARAKLNENPDSLELKAALQKLRYQADNEKNTLLTDTEKKLLDVKPFLDGIDLYQQPESYAATKKYRQKNIADIAAITASVELEEKGGVHEVYAKSLKNTAALTSYFDTLGSLIQDQHQKDGALMDHSPTDDLAITITSDDHKLGLSYNSRENSWTVIDSGSEKFAIDFKKLTASELPRALSDAFDGKLDLQLTILSAGDKNDLAYKNFSDNFSRSLAVFKKPVAQPVMEPPIKNAASEPKAKDEKKSVPIIRFFEHPIAASRHAEPASKKRKHEGSDDIYPAKKKLER